MQFGIFYEHQIPRPWAEGEEHQLFKDALEQVEVADRIGIEYVWEVEHHFLEEYSHSSAPEVFLAACSQRSKNIRLGHGIVLMPPNYNHPARVAERIATLDLISDGRVEWGTGESASRAELEGFNVPPGDKKAMWAETVRETAKMLASDPYPGYDGEFFSMPERNIVPKPLQKPHPPLWVACSNRESIRWAGKHGIGALTFAFIEPEEAKYWVDEYYTAFENECEPLGQAVNPTIAMVAGFMCHENGEERQGHKVSKDFNFSAMPFPIIIATAFISPVNLTSGQTSSKTNPKEKKVRDQAALAPRMKYAPTLKQWKRSALIRSSSCSKRAIMNTIIYANHSNISHKMYCPTSKRDTKYMPHKKQNASALPSKKHTTKISPIDKPKFTPFEAYPLLKSPEEKQEDLEIVKSIAGKKAKEDSE